MRKEIVTAVIIILAALGLASVAMLLRGESNPTPGYIIIGLNLLIFWTLILMGLSKVWQSRKQT
jgi:hypothetical protein